MLDLLITAFILIEICVQTDKFVGCATPPFAFYIYLHKIRFFLCNHLQWSKDIFISISCPLVPLCAQHNYSPAAAQDLRGSWSAAQKPEPNARARFLIAEAGHEPTLGPLLLLLLLSQSPLPSPTQFRFVLCRRRRRLSHLPQFSRFVCGFARTTSTTTTTSASTVPFLVLFLIHYQFFNGRCFCCCFSVSVCECFIYLLFVVQETTTTTGI